MCLRFRSSPQEEGINFSEWEVLEDIPEMMIYELYFEKWLNAYWMYKLMAPSAASNRIPPDIHLARAFYFVQVSAHMITP